MRSVRQVFDGTRTRCATPSTKRAFGGVLAMTVLAIMVLAAGADACPTCRTALAEGGARWAHGFAASIAVLLGVMLAAGGAFGFAVWRATRGADPSASDAPASDASSSRNEP
jgi:hypothetical protein